MGFVLERVWVIFASVKSIPNTIMKFNIIKSQNIFTILLSACLFLGGLNITKGNNVQIANATRMGANNDIIQFTLSWDNSWMVNGVPNNHDAVWVFIKFRECGVTIDEWSHALLSTNMGEHSFGPNVTYATPILTTDRFGSGSGHNTGVMIRRNTIGTGNITTQTIQLQIVGSSNGAIMDPTLEYDIKVFGIEMVNIPEGKFFAGDGASYYGLCQVGVSPLQPHLIESEASLATIDYSSYNHTLSDSFPKGYASFYIMKYEITHGQYVDFLNTITSPQQVNRSYLPTTYYYRYDVQYNGLEYYTNSIDRVLHYMSFHDVMAYLDWAALRPITELEYEKACRGALNFVQGEWAWGSGATNDFKEIKKIDGATPGIEIPLDSSNAHINVTQYTITGGQFSLPGTYGNQGPVAAGIFARQTHQQTRKGTGATYYGVMEMSGNVWEQCIQINTAYQSDNPSPYTGIWGDGQLTNGGFQNVINWPNAGFFILRGGSWREGLIRARVSDRGARGKSDYTGRFMDTGGRGAR